MNQKQCPFCPHEKSCLEKVKQEIKEHKDELEKLYQLEYQLALNVKK